MEVSAITGHKDLASLKRYTHFRPVDLARKLAYYARLDCVDSSINY